MKLIYPDRLDREKSVKVIDGQEDGLGVEIVQLADLEHPVDENWATIEADVELFGHVIRFGHKAPLKIVFKNQHKSILNFSVGIHKTSYKNSSEFS